MGNFCTPYIFCNPVSPLPTVRCSWPVVRACETHDRVDSGAARDFACNEINMDRYLGSTMFCKECMAESDIFVGECWRGIDATYTYMYHISFFCLGNIDDNTNNTTAAALLLLLLLCFCGIARTANNNNSSARHVQQLQLSFALLPVPLTLHSKKKWGRATTHPPPSVCLPTLTPFVSCLRCFFLCLLYSLSHPTPPIIPTPPDPRAGEIICRTCAVVIGERCIDDGAEWRTFVDDSSNGRADPNRCGECVGFRHYLILL